MRIEIGEKLSGMLFLFLVAVVFPWHINALVLILLVALRQLFHPLRPLTIQSAKRFWRIIRFFAAAAAVMMLVNGHLIPGEILWEPMKGYPLTREGLAFGLGTGTRLLLIATALLIFFGSTPLRDIADFLQSRGLSGQIVLTILLTISFFETLPERMTQIFTAQEARGAPVRSNFVARTKGLLLILSPLFLSSMVESIDRSMALELRGFRRETRLSFEGESQGAANVSPVTLLFLLLSFLLLLWMGSQWLLG